MTTLGLARGDSLPQGGYKSRGVVLRRKEGSARSFELLLFLNGHGAVWVGAPGADGAKNRFGGGTEPMMWGDFDLYQSPRRLYLKGVDVREHFWTVRRSASRLKMAVKWCGELAKRLPPGVENDNLLSLFWGVVKALSAGVQPALLDLRFAWRWANLWGVAPQLDRCVGCGCRIEERAAWYRGEDGAVCGTCRAANLAGVPVEGEALRIAANAAMLPREAFLAWAADARADKAEELAAWLYAKLRLIA